MSSGSFRQVIYKMCLEIIYLIYIYKNYLAINDLQLLIYYKTKLNQTFCPAQFVGTVKYTDCISDCISPTTSVVDITLKSLMVRLK